MADGIELQVRRAVCPGFPYKVSPHTHLRDDAGQNLDYNLYDRIDDK